MRRVFLTTILLLFPLFCMAQETDDPESDLLFEEGGLLEEAILPEAVPTATSVELPSIEEITNQQSPFVTIKSAIGTELQGYVVGPEDAKFGVLLLHDRWGFNENIRKWADRFAAKGYRALVIDMFDGRASNVMDKATEIMDSIDPEWVKADVQAGLRFLAAPGRKLATIGWGFGGWSSFQAAIIAPDEVAATIVMYGAIEASVEQIRQLKSPLLGVFAQQDRLVTPAHVAGYERMMKKSLITFRLYSYNGDHGFADPLYPAYNQGLADDAWQQVDSFLQTFVEQG
jgi:carboxymethylenebutenolidase